MKKILYLLISFLLFVVACDRIVDDPLGDEMARLQAWLQVNKVVYDSLTPSGMYYIKKQAGTGIAPADSSYLVYSYTKRDLDDNISETTEMEVAKQYDIFSYKTHYVPVFDQFLKGLINTNSLSEAFSIMKEGGKARFIIPPGVDGSPATATSIYDIELKKVVTNPKQFERDTLNKYLSLNPGFTSFNDSIYYKKLISGTRTCIIAKDSIVELNYTGKFIDGFVFDTNIDSVAKANNIYDATKSYVPLVLTVGSSSYIQGFSLAVKKMIEGEKAIFVIPSEIGYGVSGNTNGTPQIPPYTSLVFEIQVVKVSKKAK